VSFGDDEQRHATVDNVRPRSDATERDEIAPREAQFATAADALCAALSLAARERDWDLAEGILRLLRAGSEGEAAKVVKLVVPRGG
jgi:hypothetical protein